MYQELSSQKKVTDIRPSAAAQKLDKAYSDFVLKESEAYFHSKFMLDLPRSEYIFRDDNRSQYKHFFTDDNVTVEQKAQFVNGFFKDKQQQAAAECIGYQALYQCMTQLHSDDFPYLHRFSCTYCYKKEANADVTFEHKVMSKSKKGETEEAEVGDKCESSSWEASFVIVEEQFCCFEFEMGIKPKKGAEPITRPSLTSQAQLYPSLRV